MSDSDIRKALETRLATMPGALPEGQTQRENMKFEPVSKVPYWRVNLLPAAPANPNATGGFKRLRGIFQITLAWPYGTGVAEVEAMRDAVAARFAMGLSATANQVTAIVAADPELKPGQVVGDRWEIIIRVPYFANAGG